MTKVFSNPIILSRSRIVQCQVMHLEVCVHAYMHQPAFCFKYIQMFTQTIPTVNWNGITTYYINNHVRNYIYCFGCKKCNKGSITLCKRQLHGCSYIVFQLIALYCYAELKM